MQNARSEVTKMIMSQKNAKQSELDKQYNDAKGKIAKEVGLPYYVKHCTLSATALTPALTLCVLMSQCVQTV